MTWALKAGVMAEQKNQLAFRFAAGSVRPSLRRQEARKTCQIAIIYPEKGFGYGVLAFSW